ncbi:hypothetical protein Z947_2405 [Sulfitobacter geojensis]|nr:hypothetical protein Z947_2405 [Sulfitobacter geojensis]
MLLMFLRSPVSFRSFLSPRVQCKARIALKQHFVNPTQRNHQMRPPV